MTASPKPASATAHPPTPPEVPGPGGPATPAAPVPTEPGTPDPSVPEAPPPMQPDDPTNPIETPAPDPNNNWDGVPGRGEGEQSEGIDDAGPSAAELS